MPAPLDNRPMPAADRPFLRLSPRAAGLAAALVTVLVWTAFIVIARASAGHGLMPLDIAFLRILGAAVVLLPWGWRLTRAPGSARSLGGLSPLPLGPTAALGVFGGVAYAMLAYAGFFFAPAAHASVLMPGSLPLWTALLAVALLGDRLTPRRIAGLVLIVAGDLMVGGSSLLHAFDGGELWKGDLLFMGAAFCWGTYAVLCRRHRVDAVRATIAIIAFAALSFLPAYALLVLLGAVPSGLGQASWGLILFQMAFQGGGSVVVSGIAFTAMVGHFGPVRSTMITALVPGLSALSAVFFLNEPLHAGLLAGLALVTGGILLGVQRQAAAAAAVPPATTKGCNA